MIAIGITNHPNPSLNKAKIMKKSPANIVSIIIIKRTITNA